MEKSNNSRLDTVIGVPMKKEGLKHYYYVHLLKLTNPIDFQRALGRNLVAKESSASNALTSLTQARQQLLEIWEAPKLLGVPREKEAEAVEEYLSHFQIFTTSLTGSPVRYAWKTIAGTAPQKIFALPQYELMSVLLNHGIWLLGYAEAVVTHLNTDNEEQEENERKLAYDTLLKAAGVFDLLREITKNQKAIPHNNLPLEFSDDFIQALSLQALAQAQELTVSRALVKGNTASLIAKLARDTAEKYSQAHHLIKGLDTEGARVDSYSNYLDFKEHVFMSLAYWQHAKQFNKDHTGGPSVAAVRKAVELLEAASRKMDQLPYSSDAQRVMNSYLDMLRKDAKKLEEENERIYFDRVPLEPQALPDAHCLVKPQAFEMPELKEDVWTQEIIGSFDFSGDENKQQVKEEEEEVVIVGHSQASKNKDAEPSKKKRKKGKKKEETCVLF